MSSGLEDALRAGDVLRERWPEAAATPPVNPYLGSGRCGACFDAWGLMHAGRGPGSPGSGTGNTVLMHAEHWHRSASGVESRLPLARLVWADGQPAPPAGYRQHLELYAGRLTTELAWPGLRLTFVAQFHPEQRDVLGVEVRYDSTGGDAPVPALLLAPATDVRVGEERLAGRFTGGGPTPDGMAWAATVTAGTAESIVALNIARHEGSANIVPTDVGARVEFAGARGRHLLLIGAGAPSRGGTVADDLTQWGRASFVEAATAAWHRRWGDAYVHLPDPRRGALWARSAYYCLCSYGPDAHCPAPSHGWTGNGPGSHAPRDAAAVVPALLRLGHVDVARGVVEFYRSRLEAARAFTRRVWPAAEGATWPPHVPTGPNGPTFAQGVPGGLQFDLGATAYPAFVARETSLALGDTDWASGTAWPIVRDAARFFASLLTQQRDGTWALNEVPFAVAGGATADAIAAARYCLRTAIALAGELGAVGHEFANYRGILSDGLAPPLPPPAPEREVPGWPAGARAPTAAVLLGDVADPAALAEIGPGEDVDPERVQFYEPAENGEVLPFSLAHHGLYARAVIDAVIGGTTPSAWGDVRSANLRTPDGKSRHGR